MSGVPRCMHGRRQIKERNMGKYNMYVCEWGSNEVRHTEDVCKREMRDGGEMKLRRNENRRERVVRVPGKEGAEVVI